MSFLEVNNIHYNYELLGDRQNPAVVFISGYTADLNEWRVYAEKLQDRFHILVFDNQGVGKTVDDDTTSLTIDAMAKNTKALIEQLNIENATIVGFAMGSTIAQTIAHRYPRIVRKLIVLMRR